MHIIIELNVNKEIPTFIVCKMKNYQTKLRTEHK